MKRNKDKNAIQLTHAVVEDDEGLLSSPFSMQNSSETIGYLW
ncbi:MULTISPECIES: hypothetical protein [Bacillaceae]|nr:MULTISPECIES: hypothetical protein [Bacillaceae]